MELDAFLAPVDGGNPSGVELRNDGRFHAIERLMEPATRALRMENVKGGGTGSVAVEWAEVLNLSAELAQTGRDLRLLVIVVRALTNSQGFPGLADGLALLTRTVEQYWDTVHPELRPSPSVAEAAIRRTNALYQMQNPDTGVLGDLEFTTIFSPRGLGVVTGGDLAMASLNANAHVVEAFKGLSSTEQASMIAAHEARATRVITACRDQADKQAEAMTDLRASVVASRAALAGLEAALTERVGENGVGIKFKDIDKFLSRVQTTLNSVQGTAPAQEGAAMAETAPILNGGSGGGSGSGAAAAGAAIPGRVNNRSDVEKLLDLIIDYYQRTEPSSPMPHLAQRMRKMVPMSFLQLMEEMAPSGIKEFKTVAGVPDEKK